MVLLINDFEKIIGENGKVSNTYERDIKSNNKNNLGKVSECTEFTVLVGYDYYNTIEKKSNPFVVPSIDSNMLNSGLKNVLHLESGEYARCFFLAEKIESLPKDIYNFLINIFKAEQQRVYKSVTKAGDIDISYVLDDNTCSEYNAEFLIMESEDKNYIEFDFLDKLRKVSKEEFWSDTFGNSNVNLKKFKSIVSRIIGEWKERGITVDRIRLLSNIPFATDLNKLSSCTLYKGVSRVFDSIWWVPDNPTPLTKDTYEVIYTIVAPERENARKLGILRGLLADKIEYGDFCQYIDEDKDRVNIDSLKKELVNKLLNTPLTEELFDKYISDKQLYQWDMDRINGKEGIFTN